LIKIGIIGSRRRNKHEDFVTLQGKVMQFVEEYGKDNVTFVSGGCPKGGDRFAEILAKQLEIPIVIHYPDKSKLEANTRWAYAKICYARNTLIAQDADILVACVASDRKGGTEDTIKKYLSYDKNNLILM